jgi:hypothetical protein
MAGQTEVKGDELFGIAKKFNRELEELPLHTHSAIVEALRISVQHRQIAMQRAEHEAEMERRNQQIELQKKQVDLAMRAEERAAAAEVAAEARGSGGSG